MSRKHLFPILLAGCAPFAHGQADYPGALWNPAYSGNYQVASRPTSHPINYVVIHIMEGTYAGSISWFKNPSSNVSAHYMVRSSDGEITQMVKEKDRAYHSGVTLYNSQAVGIEHEAFSNQPQWYTDSLYRASANLTRYLTSKYSIVRNRTNILGHKETGAATSCPGPNWDWTKYMGLVLNNASYVSATVPDWIAPNQEFTVTITMKNDGGDTWESSGSDPVTIGTSAASPYYVSSDWISNTRASTVDASTPVGSNGTFTFKMKAPATPGAYSQAFQLYRSSVEAFGPTVALNFNVGQLDRVVDNSDPGFSSSGAWSTGITAAGKYGSDYKFVSVAKKTRNTATWFLNVPVGGTYQLFTWYPAGTNRTTAATFQTESRRDGVQTFTINQQLNGGTWVSLGYARFSAGAGSVSLIGQGTTGVAVADAIRVVGPY